MLSLCVRPLRYEPIAATVATCSISPAVQKASAFRAPRASALFVVRGREQVHQIARRITIGFLFEGHIKVRRFAEHVEERP